MVARRAPSSSGLSPRLWAALAARRAAIAAAWAELVRKTYPLGIPGFLRSGGDPFADPVGERTKETADLFSLAVTTERPSLEEEQALSSAMEELMRVRAVQAMSPEEAVGIFPAMKNIVRERLLEEWRTLGGEFSAKDFLDALFTLDSRVDAVALTAFGQYCRCRERLADLRLEEHKRLYSRLSRLEDRQGAKT